MSTILLLSLTAVFLCVGFLIGDIYTVVFTAISSVLATIALILALCKRNKNDR